MTTSTTSTTAQFQIIANPNWPVPQKLFQVVDANGSTIIFEIFQAVNGVHTDVSGDNLGATNSAGTMAIRFCGQINEGAIVTIHPGAVWFPDGLLSSSGYAGGFIGGGFLRAGTGIPSGSTIGGYAQEGDLYLRADGTSGTRLYQCETAGAPGTWQAIAGI